MQNMKGKRMKTSNKILLALGIIPFIVILMMIFSFKNELEKGVDPAILNPDYSSYAVKKYDFSGFDEIRAEGIWKIKLSGGNQFNVELRAPEELLDKVSIIKSGNELLIESEKNSFSMSGRAIISITMPSISRLYLDGQCEVEISDFNMPELGIYNNGVVGIVGRNSSVGRLSVNGNGALNVDFAHIPVTNALFNFSGVYMVKMQMNGGELLGNLHGPGKMMIEGKVSNNSIRTDGPNNIIYRLRP